MVNPFVSEAFNFEIDISNQQYKLLKKKYLNISIKDLVKRIKRPNFKIIMNKDLSLPENIFNIFRLDGIREGPLEYIDNYKRLFLNKIRYFTKRNAPIEFIMMAMPFKCPNPLKVSHIGPDLGEVGFILRLLDIAKLIKSIYSPGAKFTILVESNALRDIIGVTEKDAEIYFESIKKILRELDLSGTIELVDLEKIHRKIPNFKKLYQNNVRKVRDLYNSKKPDIIKDINKIVPTMILSVNVRKYKLNRLFKIFNKEIKDRNTIMARADIYSKAIDIAIRFYAFLKTRKDLEVMVKLFPNKIYCTLAPKPNRLNLYSGTKLEPHHGVGVLTKDNSIDVKYEADVRRKGNYIEVYIKGFDYPFYFEEIDANIFNKNK